MHQVLNYNWQVKDMNNVQGFKAGKKLTERTLTNDSKSMAVYITEAKIKFNQGCNKALMRNGDTSLKNVITFKAAFF